MNKSNRFSELGAALKGKESPKEEPLLPPTPKPRNRGKRSNPDYEQVGIYIQRELHLDVKKRLITEPEHDFSDLVNELLHDWLNTKTNN